uniref:Uncharacterized protein n=1 Tax=viral metagenome TaxID=1070528 RepID=A0A6C0EBH4_9ZZZZ
MYDSSQIDSYITDGNKYITEGYRKCKTVNDCLKSLFYWHNMLLDIWTSIFTILHAFATLIIFNNYDIPFICLFLVAIIHAPPSIGYHLFGCSGMSYESFLYWQRLDYSMIFFSSIFLNIALGYYILSPVTLAINVLLILFLWLYIQKTIMLNRTPHMRLYEISILVTLYFIPVYYQMYHSYMSHTFFYGVGMILSLLFGAIVYAIQWPECKIKNFVLNSHAIMHICINLAYLCEHRFILEAYKQVNKYS